MSERTGSSVLTSYPNQTLKPIGARRIGGGELERDASAREHVHRQRENRKRVLSVLKSSKANIRATKLRDEIALLEKLCKNSKSQHRRSKLFQSLRRVVKECTFLLKTVNAYEAMGKLEKNLREHFEEEKKDRSREKEEIMVPSREQLAVCVNALRATAFGIGGRGIREKIATCGIHATTEISRSFFVPFATVVLSSIARVQVLVFQWCAECAELHNVLAGLGGCMPSSSSCSFEVEKATPKTSAFKEELVVEWESEKKGKNDKEEYEENNTKSRFKDVVPRVRAFESGNDIREWDKAWAPLLVTSSSSFIPAAIQGESTISTKNRVANEEEEEDLGAKIEREGLSKLPTKSSLATTTVSLGLGAIPLVNVDKDLQKKMAHSDPKYRDAQGRDASGKRSLDAMMTKKEKKLKKKEELKKKQKLAVDPVERLKAIFEG